MNALLLPSVLIGAAAGVLALHTLRSVVERRQVLRQEAAECYLHAHDICHAKVMEEGLQIQRAAAELEAYDTQVTASGENRQAYDKEADWLEAYCRQFIEDGWQQLEIDHWALKRFPKRYRIVICLERHAEWDVAFNFADKLESDLVLRRTHR